MVVQAAVTKTAGEAGKAAGKTAKTGVKGVAKGAGKAARRGGLRSGRRLLSKGAHAGGQHGGEGGRPGLPGGPRSRRRLLSKAAHGIGRAARNAGKGSGPGSATNPGQAGKAGINPVRAAGRRGADAARRAPGQAAQAAQGAAGRGAAGGRRGAQLAENAARSHQSPDAQSQVDILGGGGDRGAKLAGAGAVMVASAAARRSARLARGTVRWTSRAVPIPIVGTIVGLVVLILVISLVAAIGGNLLDHEADAEEQAAALAALLANGGSGVDNETLAAHIANNTEIPLDAARAYVSAAAEYDVDWPLLAGVGKMECDHGRSQLAGCNPPGTINSAGARGPMQFLGSTWRAGAGTRDLDVSGPPVEDGRGYATDGSGDGIADPWDWYDATHSAARYLVVLGAAEDPAQAAFGYFHGGGASFNPNHFYHQGVIEHATQYLEQLPPLPSFALVGDLSCPVGTLPAGGTERVTEPGNITNATQAMLDAVVPCFGRTSGISCFSPRDGSGRTSPVAGLGGLYEHPRGRACDLMMTCGGCTATGEQRAHGDALANWLRANAASLNVIQVIWFEEIWTPGRDSEGWRPYSGDSAHVDHVHVSMDLMPGDPAWARCPPGASCTPYVSASGDGQAVPN